LSGANGRPDGHHRWCQWLTSVKHHAPLGIRMSPIGPHVSPAALHEHHAILLTLPSLVWCSNSSGSALATESSTELARACHHASPRSILSIALPLLALSPRPLHAINRAQVRSHCPPRCHKNLAGALPCSRSSWLLRRLSSPS
jgi:hypothetical protein